MTVPGSWPELEARVFGAHRASFAKAALHSFSSFCLILDHTGSAINLIATATDGDMCNALGIRTAGMCRSAESTLRCRLKLCLSLLVSDGPSRWPNFWTGGLNRRLDEERVTPTNTLPREVFRQSETAPLYVVFRLLLHGIQKYTNRRSVPSIRAALSFLYGFLFRSGPGSMFGAEVRTTDAFLTAIRNKTRRDVCLSYKEYREKGRCFKGISLTSLSRHVYILNAIFVQTFSAFKEPITMDLFGIYSRKRTVTNRDTATAGSSDASSSRFSLALLQSTTDLDLSKMICAVDGVSDKDIHVFSASEVQTLYRSCHTLLEKILFCLLFGTGMRIGGFCRLLYPQQGKLADGDSLTTREKGGKVVRYRLTGIMTKLVNDWLTIHCRKRKYLFAHAQHDAHHIQTRNARRIFMSVAERGGVVGSHVHPHTTRHTVIWTLWALGNPLEVISKFVHHKQTSTTMERYIRPTDEHIADAVHMPWVETPSSQKQDLKQTAMELSRALCSPFGSKPACADDPMHCTKGASIRDSNVDKGCVDVIPVQTDIRRQRKQRRHQRTEELHQLLKSLSGRIEHSQSR